jgi:hypothetical protein
MKLIVLSSHRLSHRSAVSLAVITVKVHTTVPSCARNRSAFRMIQNCVRREMPWSSKMISSQKSAALEN